MHILGILLKNIVIFVHVLADIHTHEVMKDFELKKTKADNLYIFNS